jgi:hypothetical protein
MTITHSLNEKLAASQSIIVIDQLNSICKINLVSNKPQAIVQTFFKKEKHLKNFKNLARSLFSHIPIYETVPLRNITRNINDFKISNP